MVYLCYQKNKLIKQVEGSNLVSVAVYALFGFISLSTLKNYQGYASELIIRKSLNKS